MNISPATRPLSLYNLLLSVPGALFLADATQDQVIFVELDSFLSYTQADFPSLSALLEIIHPDDRAEYALLDFAEGQFSPGVINLRMRKRGGDWDMVQLRINPISRAASGRIEKCLIHAVPLAGVKSLFNHLLENESKFRALVTQAPVGIGIVDSRGRVVEWNARQEEITGVPSGEAIGKLVWSLSDVFNGGRETSIDEIEKMIRRALTSGQANWFNRTIEFNLNRKDGQFRRVSVIYFPIQAPTGLMIGSVSQDITEIYLAEQASHEQTLRAEAVARLASRINAEIDLNSILDAACTEAAQTLNVAYSAIYLYHPDTNEYRAARMFGPVAEDFEWLVENPLHPSDYPFLRDPQKPILVIPDINNLAEVDFPDELKLRRIRTLLMASMRYDDRLVGLLCLGTVKETRSFSQNELTLLQIISDQVAMALARARLFEVTQKQSQHLQILNEITRTALSSSSLSHMLEVLTEKTASLFQAAGCHAWLWDPQRNLPVSAAGYGKGKEFFAAHPLPALPQLQDLFDGGRPVVDHHVAGCEILVSLPLKVNQKKLGLFFLCFDQPPPYASREDLPWLDEITSQLSLAIGRAILLDQERQHRLQAENLQKATAALTSSLNLSYVLDSILTHLFAVIPVESAAIAILEQDELYVAASRGLPNDSHLLTHTLPHEYGFFSLLKNTITPVVIGNIDQHPLAGLFASEIPGVKSWAGIPMVAFGKRIGYLINGSSREQAFSAEDAMQAQALANQAAIAIQNARLFQEVSNSSERLQVLSKKLVSVQEDERRFLAHELHDEIGQSLTATILNIEMSKRLDGQAQKQCLNDAQTLVEKIMEQVREMSLQLRPGVLDVLGLLPALRWLFERFQTHTGIQIHHNLTNQDHRFLPDVEITAFRVTQEALTNVARHAGVKEAFVTVKFGLGELSIRIEDQGCGFDPRVIEDEGLAFGLTGMSERIRLVGGRLIINSLPGTGTSITAVFPDRQDSAEVAR